MDERTNPPNAAFPGGLRAIRAVALGVFGLAAAVTAVAQTVTASSGMPKGIDEVAAVSNLGTCVELAAEFHKVNGPVLYAILRHESRLRPTTVVSNTNGTYDIGIGGINSVHLPELRSVGVTPPDLLNACVGTFVTAWKLSQHMHRWGNSWWAIGAYHSITPRHNARYQVLIWNELVEMGAVHGPKRQVPS